MDETTSIIVMTSLVQTTVITLTLVVFIFQFRSQEKALKESSYQNLMGRYNDFIMMRAAKPEVDKLLRDAFRGSDSKGRITREDASVDVHLMIAYGIIEEAYLLYAKKWIDKETWEQWAAWLKTLASSVCSDPQENERNVR